MLAIDGIGAYDAAGPLLATEFLRETVKAERAFTLQDVARAADALYGDEPGIRILSLRETEETCACSEYYPGVWTQ